LQRTPYLFRLINWECLTSPTFFCNDPIWLAHCKKKLKLWKLPKNSWNYGSFPKFVHSLEFCTAQGILFEVHHCLPLSRMTEKLDSWGKLCIFWFPLLTY
jgi:hypothetical protein